MAPGLLHYRKKGVVGVEELIRQIEEWNEGSEFTRAIGAIEAIPEGERGFLLTLWLGRLYSNLAVLGDRDEKYYKDDRGGCSREEPDGDMLRRAVDILLSVREEGQSDATWNSRMAFALWMMEKGREAMSYAQRWLKLAPEDPDAAELVENLKEFLMLTGKGKKY